MATKEEARSPLEISLPDRYELERQMATGGMASVWCGRDRLLDRTVAIKLMAEQLTGDETAVRRFKREAKAAARLSGHRNVITIYDVGQARPRLGAPAGQPFIVMERLLGGTVADALRVAPVRPGRALKWLGEAAAAIDFAHSRGVIHRDIKPSNFLLDSARVLHVADFGIALVATEETLSTSGALLGTAAYLAPEVALGQPGTEASDRYALAVAAFELLTSQRPFTARHFAAQARQHVETPPPKASLRNPRLPEAVDRALEKGMAKRPEERFATASDFVAAIDEALGAAPATAATKPLPRRTPIGAQANRTPRRAPVAAEAKRVPRPAPVAASAERRRRRRAVALGGLAALLVAVGIAAAVAGRGGQPQLGRAMTGSLAQAIHSPASAATRSPKAAAPRPTPASAGGPASPRSADALEARGHQLMMSGNYKDAIPVLRQAVAAAPHGSLTYAYALYDLGRSLRLAGNPQAAIPILEQRLQIPNQTDVVKQELALAQAQAGQGGAPTQAGPTPAGGPPPAAPGHQHQHGAKHKGEGEG